MQVVDAAGLSGAPHASFAFTALGLAQAAAGEMAAAEATIEQGLVLRRKNPAQGPWGALHHILAASRVALLAGERGTAKQLAEEASARMDRYPQGMECMRQRLRLVEDAISTTPTVSQQSETLTDRELDVLRLLQGSLSLSEIANGALHLPQHGQDPRQGRVPEAGRRLPRPMRSGSPAAANWSSAQHGDCARFARSQIDALLTSPG